MYAGEGKMPEGYLYSGQRVNAGGFVGNGHECDVVGIASSSSTGEGQKAC